jgi:hypothetical protein
VTIQERFASAVDRISAATSVMRARSDDVARLERNGNYDEVSKRAEDAVKRLEAVAADLEKALA